MALLKSFRAWRISCRAVFAGVDGNLAGRVGASTHRPSRAQGLVLRPRRIAQALALLDILVAEAFAAHGLEMPNVSMRTLSVHMRTQLIATGDFITTLPRSVLRLYAERFSLKALPVDLPARPWPVSIITLKHRSLSPIVQRFIRCAEDVANGMDARPRSRKSS